MAAITFLKTQKQKQDQSSQKPIRVKKLILNYRSANFLRFSNKDAFLLRTSFESRFKMNDYLTYFEAESSKAPFYAILLFLSLNFR